MARILYVASHYTYDLSGDSWVRDAVDAYAADTGSFLSTVWEAIKLAGGSPTAIQSLTLNPSGNLVFHGPTDDTFDPQQIVEVTPAGAVIEDWTFDPVTYLMSSFPPLCRLDEAGNVYAKFVHNNTFPDPSNQRVVKFQADGTHVVTRDLPSGFTIQDFTVVGDILYYTTIFPKADEIYAYNLSTDTPLGTLVTAIGLGDFDRIRYTGANLLVDCEDVTGGQREYSLVGVPGTVHAFVQGVSSGVTAQMLGAHYWSGLSGETAQRIVMDVSQEVVLSWLPEDALPPALSGATSITSNYYEWLIIGPPVVLAGIGDGAAFVDGEVSHPLTWLGLTDRAGELHNFSEVDLNDPAFYYGGFKAAWVVRFLTIARGLSDRVGQIEHTSFGALLSDAGKHATGPDRFFRTLLADDASPATKYLTNRPLQEWFVDDEVRRVQGLPRLAAVGFVSDYSPKPNLQFQINGSDWLKKKFTRKREAQQSWQPLLLAEDMPYDCPEETLNTPCPLIYGSLGLSGADAVVNVAISVAAQPDAAPANFSLSVGGGTSADTPEGIRKYYKVSGIVGGIETIQSPTRMATTTDSNRTITADWDAVPGATAINLYRSHRPDFSQFVRMTLAGAATTFDDEWAEGGPTNADILPWTLGQRLTLTYYIYAILAGGLLSQPGQARIVFAPIPSKIPTESSNPKNQRDITLTWDAHPDEVGGYTIVRHRRYYTNSHAAYTRQWDVATGVLTTTDDATTTYVFSTLPGGELLSLSAAGQALAIPVGTSAISGAPVQKLMLCRHPCARVGDIYLPVTVVNDDGTTGIEYVPVPASDYGSVWWKPEAPGYPHVGGYEDINGRSYTPIYTTLDPLPESVYVDVDGIEDVGDRTGTLIRSIVSQRLHFINNFLAPDVPWQSGPYLTADDTLFPHIEGSPGLPLVDVVSHDAVQAETELRVTGGYEGAGIIGANGEFVSATDVLAWFNVSGDFDQVFNRKGQDTISMEPITAPVGLTPITDVINIADGSFQITDQVQQAFFNILPFVHTRDYTGRTKTGWQGMSEVRSQLSIDAYDQERESPRYELHFGRTHTAQQAATVGDVMARKLARFQDPRRHVTFTGPFSLLNYEPGDVVAITHAEGVGAAGWEGRHVRLTRHEVDPTDGRVRAEGYDYDAVLQGGSP